MVNSEGINDGDKFGMSNGLAFGLNDGRKDGAKLSVSVREVDVEGDDGWSVRWN